ncbi:carbohydrate ABC transporter permease [Paenibacillus amylolyticus]|nr:carbohydrate ABC transporter permease [Paenibacillus amylolyticus]
MSPSYLLVKDLGMVNSMWALILPGAASIWNIIVCRTFFQSTIPKELQEAAHIDGCTNTRLFIKIVLLLSMPIIAVMALFYGVGHWNSYFSAMIYLNDSSKYPLQLFLRQILVLQEMAAQGEALSIRLQQPHDEYQSGDRCTGQICCHYCCHPTGHCGVSIPPALLCTGCYDRFR